MSKRSNDRVIITYVSALPIKEAVIFGYDNSAGCCKTFSNFTACNTLFLFIPNKLDHYSPCETYRQYLLKRDVDVSWVVNDTGAVGACLLMACVHRGTVLPVVVLLLFDKLKEGADPPGAVLIKLQTFTHLSACFGIVTGQTYATLSLQCREVWEKEYLSLASSFSLLTSIRSLFASALSPVHVSRSDMDVVWWWGSTCWSNLNNLEIKFLAATGL